MINTKFKKLAFSEMSKKGLDWDMSELNTGNLKCICNFLFFWIYMKKSETNMAKCKHLFKLRDAVAAAAASLQSCPTLCDPIDGSAQGPPIPGILQARTLEWVAISFSSAWKRKGKAKSLSRVQLFATPWTAAYQAPPSTGFSRQEYWSGVFIRQVLLLNTLFI